MLFQSLIVLVKRDLMIFSKQMMLKYFKILNHCEMV